jgi:hypothetical protein
MAGTLATALAIAGIAAGTAGVGTAIYEGDKNRSASADATASQKALLAQQQQSAANQANLTKQEAVLGVQGQEQQQTGGSLTDSGTSALTDLLAGYPGYQGGATGGGTSTGAGIGPSGISGGTATTPTSGGAGSAGSAGSAGGAGTPDISAILAALRGQGGAGSAGSPSSISGGNWQTQPAQPQNQFELANPVV